jgi:hypothetical protein
MGRRLRQNLEGNRKQGVAGEHRGRLVEGHMSRRQPPPQIIIVHAGQIVVDQGIGVQNLDGSGHPQSAGGIDAKQGRGAHDQERPQPLSPRENSIAHSLVDALMQTMGLGQNPAQHPIHILGHACHCPA